MRHVFVETNWVVGYAAPAHHKMPDAVRLLERARAGELTLHLPAICLMEARLPISKFQPRQEADAIRAFLLWARKNAKVDEEEQQIVRRVLDMYEGKIRTDLSQFPEIRAELRNTPRLEVFPRNDRMLQLETELASASLDLKPFDLAVLAAILGRAGELLEAGASSLAFCELDTDLQPWTKDNRMKQPLTDLYDERRVWVYGDFALRWPSPPPDWPGGE